MTGELIFYAEDGKPVFSDEYYEIEKDFVDIEPVTTLGGDIGSDEVMELYPENDLTWPEL